MPFLMSQTPALPAPKADSPRSTFPLFSLLAAELRLKIWVLAFESRIVSVRYLPTKERCVSSTAPPPLLSVNRESRYETLRRYKLFFSTPKSPSKIYFNPNLDTIYLPRYRDMGYDETLRDFRCYLSRPDELDRVRWLALDQVESSIKRPWESYDKAVLIKSFGNLCEIYLVLGSGKRRQQCCKDVAMRNDALRKTKKGIEFIVPQEAPEVVSKIWANFRNAFSREESLVVEMFHSSGLAYEPRSLPAVTVVAR